MRRETGDGTTGGSGARRPWEGAFAGALCAASLAGFALPGGVAAQDDNGGVLAECAALSPLLDDIHLCLDNYLDAMDVEIADIAELIDGSLEGESRTAFAASQRAFVTYRRDNCLWYLAFSTPRAEAEQIAKDCLATMSLQRLSELQRLITENDGSDALQSGYYVYGASRNTFRPCGSEARYWVEGDTTAVAELQQQYLNTATEELQVLFATLRGALDDGAATTSGHDGVLRTTALVELRVPREADCRLPAGAPSVVATASAEAASEAALPVPEETPLGDAADEEPTQQLIAYFGAWVAVCTESAGSRLCVLSTLFDDGRGAEATDTLSGVASGEATSPQLSLIRRDAGRTRIELRLPEREVDSPAKFRWSVDDTVFGDIIDSTIRVDEMGTRQIIEDSPFVAEELLPRMIAGGELVVEVLDTVDDERGDRLSATLVGVTRALAFADDFVRDGNGL